MRRWIVFCFPLVAMFILTGFGLTPLQVKVPEQLIVKEPLLVSYPKNEASSLIDDVKPPFIGSRYNGFKEALAFKESRGDYFVTNTYGYLGKYQFGISTLEVIGVYNGNDFLNNPELQEKVFKANVARNKWILRKDIKKYVGTYMHGFEVTESGIVAAAHLAGAGNVRKYLRSQGRMDLKDGYGTSVSNYMKKFSGYDISMILPKRKHKV